MYFNHLQKTQNRVVKLPFDLTAHLSLYNYSEQCLTFINSSEQNKYCELVISPIPLEKRKALWILRISFFDRPGIVQDLTTFLKINNIDILNSRVELSEFKFLNVKMVIDVQNYTLKFNEINNTANIPFLKIKTLKTQIVARFIREIIFHNDSKLPIIEIEKNYALIRTVTIDRIHDLVKLKNSQLVIPKDIYSNILIKLNSFRGIAKSKLKGNERLYPFAAIVSYLEYLYFKVFIFYPNTGIIHIRVSGRNTVGALSALTRTIKDNKFNILQMFQRDKSGEKLAINDFILDIDIKDARHTDDIYLKNFLERNILKSELAEEYEWEVSFPRLLQKRKFDYYG